MSMSHWAVVALVAVVLFGRDKISGAMGDLAQGIRSFKRGMRDDGDAQA